MLTVMKPCSSIHGSLVTSTTPSISSRGSTSTSTLRGAKRQSSEVEAALEMKRRLSACLFALTFATGALSVAALAAAADMSKTLRTAIIAPETGFDPAATSDLYSDSIARAIFETLYSFDYLARPYRRVPQTAAAMPEIA